MAYLHCHTKGCGWSQDDFWTRTYNPLTKLGSMVKWLARPRYIHFDTWCVEDLQRYTGVNVGAVNTDKGMRVHSWRWLLLELVKIWRLFRDQTWWTWESWKRASKTATCPKCGQRNFDVD